VGAGRALRCAARPTNPLTLFGARGALLVVSKAQDDVLDVAIVGGGVAGTYTAWRLLCDRGDAAGAPPKLAIFEGSDRIGGRLLSLRPPGMRHLVCELGGMYFTSVHPMVCAIAAKLGLAVQEMPHTKLDTLYVRRKRFRADLSRVPYDFAPEESAVSPDALLPWAMDKVIPGITKLTGKALDDALRDARVEGLPVADWGFWNLLTLALSSEGFSFVRDSAPNDYMLINANAVDAIRGMQIFASPDVKVFHVTDGYDQIPQTLCRKFEEAGGTAHRRHRLQRFERDDEGLLRLHFSRDGEGWGPGASGEPVTVQARSLVLAMPKRSLELLQQSGPVFETRDAQRMFASVTSIPMFKMFSCYSSPWWKGLGFGPSGMGVTDMPLKACMYWGTEGEQAGADDQNTNSLLLTSLEDMMSASYWAGLSQSRDGTSFASKTSSSLHGLAGDDEWARYADDTTERLVREAQLQLSELHGITVPEPYAAASRNWTADPFGGALCMWNAGTRSELLVEKILQPVEGIPVYVCGESFSRSQGWVEGALETSELLLQRHLGLTAPTWLSGGERANKAGT
jgi:monoamine oxidase